MVFLESRIYDWKLVKLRYTHIHTEAHRENTEVVFHAKAKDPVDVPAKKEKKKRSTRELFVCISSL